MKYFRPFQYYAKKYDKFDAPITFRYQGDDSYSSQIGGLITFVIFFLALFFVYGILFLFIKEKIIPYIILQLILIKQKKLIYINQNHLQLLISNVQVKAIMKNIKILNQKI